MADNVGQIETIDCRTSSTAAGGSCMHAAADGQDDRVWIVRYQAMLHRLLTRNARYIAYRDTKRCIGTFAFVVYFSFLDCILPHTPHTRRTYTNVRGTYCSTRICMHAATLYLQYILPCILV